MTRTPAGFLGAAVTVAAMIFGAERLLSQNIESALPQVARAPAGNAPSQARVALGRLLFWDPILSGANDVACVTCHHPRFGYAENRDLSIGATGIGLGDRRHFAQGSSIPVVKRNSPTILNVAFAGSDEAGNHSPSTAPMFWDNRVRSLETQALEPLKSLEEMRGRAHSENTAVAAAVARLNAVAEYQRLFTGAYGGEQAVTADHLGKALAAFQRSLVANNAPFDRYRRGETDAMTDAQLRGMRRFERIGCIRCHTGPMFSDYKLHVLGVPDNPKLTVSDSGAEKTYAFRTASLRNLEFTAPYMHSGVFQTLSDVLEFYDDVRGRGRGRNQNQFSRARNPNVNREQLDPLLRQLRGVNERDEDLIAFLGALSDGSYDRTIPTKVPSGLQVGGRIQ